MWFGGGLRSSVQNILRSSVSSDGGGNNIATAANSLFVRYMSRKRSVNVRKINPKVPIQDAYAISNSLYDLIKHLGPLSVSNTWIHAKEAGVSGLNSKTHMKIMLKWMRGRKMLKLICNQVGSNKKFLHCTLPEEPRTEQNSEPQPLADDKPSRKGKKKKRAK